MAKPPREVGLVLLPRFSLAALGSVMGVIEAVNDLTGDVRLNVRVLAESGDGAVASASQIRVLGSTHVSGENPAQVAAQAASESELLFVIGDAPLPEVAFERIVSRVSLASKQGAFVVGVGTGAWILARAGVLNGKRATIHWPYASLFAERFPDVVVSSHIFEIDGSVATAAGGQAGQDLMLALVARFFDADTAADVMDQLGIERARASDERQRVPLSARIGGGQPKLTEAVLLMEANFEEPLPTEEIAALVGVSRRQLERLFKQHLDSLPARYYLEMRLNRARQLLRESSQSILQIGLACGFSSGPHFSSAYRSHFQVTPRDERSRRLAALAAAPAGPIAATTAANATTTTATATTATTANNSVPGSATPIAESKSTALASSPVGKH
jgi:AraC family transcriptional regulator, L-arginine-responsive activator